MGDFNPDKFLAETAPKAKAEPFNPDKFLAETAPLPAKAGPSTASALMRGGAQGATLGFADEAVGALGGLYDYAMGKLGQRGDIGLADAYHTRRDSARKADAAAEAAHPGAYVGGEVLGGLATAVVPGAAALNASKGAGVAEVLGKSALQGALSGAGGAKEITDIPEAMYEGGKAGAVIGGGLHGLGALAKAAGPKIAKIVGGVEEANLKKYLAAPERINAQGAQPETAVMDAVDSGVAHVTGDRDALAAQVAKAEEGLNAAYHAKKVELAGAVTPLEKAKEMTAALEAQKGYLGSLSEQADDALVRSGASFKKSDLLRTIDKIGTDAGSAIGDEAHSALSKLQATRDRIAAQLPNDIPAVNMRDVLKQLRRDVNFDQGAGEFNDTLNGMRKDFSGKISNALKKQVPEYAAYMSRMSDLAENLGTMNRYFGDEAKSLGSLEALRKGGPRAQLIESALENHATVNADQTMLEHLGELRGNQALLGRIKAGEDLRPELFPQQWNALQEAKANAQMGQAVAEPIERLGPNRTQAVIKNQGGTVPNVVDRRALEQLSQATGENFPQMISDKNVFDSFKKGATEGSRKAVLGGSVGASVGFHMAGPAGAAVGLPIGTAAGATLDKYGPALVKSGIDLTGKVAESPYIVPLLEAAKKGNKTLAITEAYLLANDPSYRNLLKRDAIQRRIEGGN